MADDSWDLSGYQILHYVAGVAMILLVIGYFTHVRYGNTGITVLNFVVSGVLTASLVILYFRQTTILESQRDLLTRELNREARQQHTETLRERVRTWHGNPDNESSLDPIEVPEQTLPRVNQASFESPSTGWGMAATSVDDTFQVIPDKLQDDRYLEDLLANHAPDLQEAKEEIEGLHERFTALREEFGQEYQDGIIHDDDQRTFKPRDDLAKWIFDLEVMRERDELHSPLREMALQQIDGAGTATRPDDAQILIKVDRRNKLNQIIYSVKLPEASSDPDELRELSGDVKEDAKEVIVGVLEKIDGEYPYELAHEAADTLDEASEAIAELEQILIEYEGRPIYTGDCKYLREARV